MSRSKSSSLNVKVKRVTLIEALRNAIKERETRKTDYAKAQKEWEKTEKDFRASLVALIGTKKLTLKDTNYRERGYRSEGAEVEFTFAMSGVTFPEQPEVMKGYTSWQTDQEIAEIKNAVAILEMSDEEYVSASTYKGVAQYL